MIGKCCGTGFLGVGAHSQRRQCRDDGGVVDRDQVSDPVVVVDGHAHPVREGGQPGIGHGCHLAWWVGPQRTEPVNSMVSTPPMMSAIPAIINGVRGSSNNTRAARATRATPQADHTP